MEQQKYTHNVYPLQTPKGEESAELIATARKYWSENYKPRDMILSHGKGSILWDLDGNDYVDLGSGIAVSSLGHQEPDLLAALHEQAGKLWHTSNIFYTQPAIDLAEMLVESTPFAKRAYFCNSGAEAIEAAIKVARKWGANNGRAPDHREIITFAGSFHGRTLAAVTATAQPKYHEGFEPLPAGFVYCNKFNDIEALKACISERSLAIIIEPVQGEGGITPATREFMQAVRALCDEHNMLLIADEIQCGISRTGVLFGHLYADDMRPDIMTLAKALGCGVPIGAMLLGEKVEHVLQVGSHGTTYGGNPIMCAVALKAFEKLKSPTLLANVVERSAQAFIALNHINDELNIFSQVRGRGLMIGAELIPSLHNKAPEISEHLRKYGVLVLVAGNNVMRFLPPLNITANEMQLGMERVALGLQAYMSASK
jgi:acetylornithine/N-succinyldiaminopimelate aminotransferase